MITKNEIKANDIKKVEEYNTFTYFSIFDLLLIAIASANLFLNPFPKPKSNKLNQFTIEYMVTQTPYFSASKLLKV